MEEQGSNKGLWAGCILAIVVAVTFVVLWHLRGNDIDALKRAGVSAASSAESARQSLERDLRDARSAADANARKANELDGRLTAEQRRTAEAERRFRSDADFANSRLAQANAELAELRTASEQQGGQAAAELQTRLDAVTREKEQLASDVESANARIAAAGEEMNAARQEIARLTAESDDLKAHANTIGNELVSANAAVANAETEASRKQEGAIADLRRQLEEVGKALGAARNSNALLEKSARDQDESHERERAAAKERTDALQAELDTLRQQLADAGQDSKQETAAGSEEKLAGLEAQAAEWREKAEALDKELTAARSERDAEVKKADTLNARIQVAETQYVERIKRASASADERLTALEKNLQDKITASQNKTKELLAQLREADKRLTEQTADWETRLTAEKTAAATRIAQLEAQVGDLKANASHLATELNSAAADTAPADAAPAPEAKAPEPEENAPVAQEEAAEQEGTVEEEEATEETEETSAADESEQPYTMVLDPDRHLGEIVELLSDGKTYLVTAGSAQDLQPGMRLDVHRRVDGGNRYIAQIEIVNVLSEDFSMAAVLPHEPVMICPVTGRAVRSGAENSPFVATADGQVVALRDSAALDVTGDVPAIGDIVDNSL